MTQTFSMSSSLRLSTVAAFLRYNEEDLDATWAVYSWLRDVIRPQFEQAK